EFERRSATGERFVVPITAVIETGNHIVQATRNRRATAERLKRLLDMARTSTAPFVLNTAQWDDSFLADLCAGDGTGQSLVDLLGNGHMGAGDVAILVERDQFKARSAFTSVGVWTLETTLGAYS